MIRRALIFTTLLVSTVLMNPVWAVEKERRPKPEAGTQPEGQVREREGGRRMSPGELRQDAKDGTEEGLPDTKMESFDRRERFRVEPRWRLGVFAYNTETGVVITRVMPGSAAWRVGFEPGDRIVAVGGFQVGLVDEQIFYLGEELQHRADPRGRVRILAQNVRDDRLLNIDVQLDGQRYREPQIPLPRERSEGERPER